MKRIRMENAFNLPVKRSNSRLMCAKGKFLSGAEHAEYSAIAINQHDGLLDEVEHLKGEYNKAGMRERNKYLLKMKNLDEENKMLREALIAMTDYAETCQSLIPMGEGELEAMQLNSIEIARRIIEQTK